MASDRAELDAAVDALRPALVSLAECLHAQPKLAFEEQQAATCISEHLREAGLGVECPLGGLEPWIGLDGHGRHQPRGPEPSAPPLANTP